MPRHKVLIVEDEHDIAGLIKHTLERGGDADAEIVSSGDAALAAVTEQPPDLIILDLNLPVISGLDVCRILRSRADVPHVPIIMLTARTSEDDRVAGLEHGADDYVTKPFSLRELTARVRAVLRRARPTVRLLHLGGVTIDFERLKAARGIAEIDLTHRDFEILKYLAERPNSIVSRNELLRAIWGYPDAANTRAVDHAIARLRKKIEDVPHKPRFIHTVHGDGYTLTVEAPSGEGTAA